MVAFLAPRRATDRKLARDDNSQANRRMRPRTRPRVECQAKTSRFSQPQRGDVTLDRVDDRAGVVAWSELQESIEFGDRRRHVILLLEKQRELIVAGGIIRRG